MPAATTVTSQIPPDLAEMLDKVATTEERSKSYYVKKGLEMILRQRLEDIQDYEDAVEAYDEFVASGERALSMEEVFGRE